MRCPNCQNEDTKVLDSRPVDEATAIRRRRECEKCDFRFSTYEEIEIQKKAKDGEISSLDIGDIVMKKIKKVDKIAYIRFAAVYRQFADVEEFKEALEKL